MINGPFNTSPNYDSIDSDFQDNHQSEEYSENFIQRNLNDDEEVDINNHQSETGINMSNDLVPIINEAPHNENNSENKKDFISKKRKKTKKSNEKKENKNKKEKDSHRDNSIKEGIKALLLIIKIIIEIFGNITLPKFDCNEFVGGTLQNKILCKSKIYQILCSDEDYREILIKAKPANPENEKKFNYFLTSTYNDLFQKYYNSKDKVFSIEGKEETITLFRTFKEEIKRRKEIVYKSGNEAEKEKKIKNFIDASELIFNNFKGCKKRERAKLKHYDKIKIDKFENYHEQNNNSYNNQEKEKEKEEIHGLIKKSNDGKSLMENLDDSKSEELKELKNEINESQSRNDEIFSGINPNSINNISESNLLPETFSFNVNSLFMNKTTNDEDNNMPSPVITQNYRSDIFGKIQDDGFFNNYNFQ